MKSPFYHKITSGKALKSFREGNKNYVLDNLSYMEELTNIAFTVSDKNHHKAFWVIELICEEYCELFNPFINEFCTLLSFYKEPHTKRPVSRICMFIAKNKGITLSKKQEKLIIENCLDWLITNEKIAVKVYAMRALYYLSKTNEWVIPELKQIISQDYPAQSAGYKAATRDILKKLK
jgi:hypothetical protein